MKIESDIRSSLRKGKKVNPKAQTLAEDLKMQELEISASPDKEKILNRLAYDIENI